MNHEWTPIDTKVKKEEATTDDTNPSLPITEIFESGKEESRKGISEIEGKGAMGSAERALAVSEFQMRKWARGFCMC